MTAHLEVVPVSLTEARMWVDRVHRHHRAPQGGLFAIAVARDAEIVGVAIVGRPASRNLDDGWTVEVTRVAVIEGIRNACSKLYAAAWRTARGMGYRRAVTYTLQEEPGTSVEAAGWKCIGKTAGGSWSRDERPRIDRHPLQAKLRWEVTVLPQAGSYE